MLLSYFRVYEEWLFYPMLTFYKATRVTTDCKVLLSVSFHLSCITVLVNPPTQMLLRLSHQDDSTPQAMNRHDDGSYNITQRATEYPWETTVQLSPLWGILNKLRWLMWWRRVTTTLNYTTQSRLGILTNRVMLAWPNNMSVKLRQPALRRNCQHDDLSFRYL